VIFDFATLAATVTIAFVFVGAGALMERLAAGRTSDDLVAPVYWLAAGWAAFAVVAASCAIVGLKLTWPTALVSVAGLIGIVGLLATTGCGRLGPIALACLIAAPLAVIASAIPPTMVDEFLQWLPNARTLIELDGFATAPDLTSAKPGYPPASTLVSYLAARFFGQDFELATKVMTVLLLAGLGLTFAEPLQKRSGRIAAIAIGVIAATVLNPFVDPRIALTAHPDTPSAALLALCVIACVRNTLEPERLWWWRIASTGVLLVLLRESNAVFVAGIAFGLLCLGRRGWPTMIGLVVPSFAVFTLWRIHLYFVAIPPSFEPRPMAEWDWSVPLTLLREFLTGRIANNPALGAASLLLAAAGIALVTRVLRAGSAELKCLYVVTAGVTAVWLTFLACFYMATVEPENISAAMGLWRYLSQLGLLASYLALAAIAELSPWPREPLTLSRPTAGRLIGGALLFVVGWTSATYRHWRIDCRYPDVILSHMVGKELAKRGWSGDTIYFAYRDDPSWYGAPIDYALHRDVYHTHPLGDIGTAPHDGDIVDLTAVDRTALLAGQRPPTIRLLRWSGTTWTQLLSVTTPDPMDGCPLLDWKRER
jgi:hypothetical protein